MTPNGLMTRDDDYVINFFFRNWLQTSLYFTEEDCKRLEMFAAQRLGYLCREHSFPLPLRSTRWTVNFIIGSTQ